MNITKYLERTAVEFPHRGGAFSGQLPRNRKQSMKKSLVEELGWEGCWSGLTLILLAVIANVPALRAAHGMSFIVSANGLA